MIFWVLDYTGSILAVVFGLVSCGLTLHYLSELVEDYPKQSKAILRYVIWLIILMHAGLYLFDSLPFINVSFGILSHLWYNLLIDSFPYIEFSNVYLIGALVLVVIDHFQWFYHFTSYPRSVSEILSFFVLMVWLIPLFYFISIVGPENVLPKQVDGVTASPILAAYSPHNSNGDLSGSSSTLFRKKSSFASITPVNTASSAVGGVQQKRNNLFRKAIELLRPPSPTRIGSKSV